jgi:hypothetical protein
MTKKNLDSIADIIKNKQTTRDHRNSYEYQAYGNRLAEEFSDGRHRALYIKYAKTKDRKLVERARDFVMNQEHITYKGKLFMWKLKQLEAAEKEEKSEAEKETPAET